MSPAALRLRGIDVWEWDDRAGRRHPILHGIDWTVEPGESWAVLGPNGAGKSTLLAVAAGLRHPSRGEAFILGAQVGHVDLRALRERVGHVDTRLAARFAPRRTALEVVLTGATGSIALLEQVGCLPLAGRLFRLCSQGERARVLLARALMRQPPLLILDEPGSGLDLGGREALLAVLAELAGEEPRPATVLVTHHLEELPATTDHALLLRQGRVTAAGAVDDVLTAPALTACFGLPVDCERHDDGRWSARATAGWLPSTAALV